MCVVRPYDHVQTNRYPRRRHALTAPANSSRPLPASAEYSSNHLLRGRCCQDCWFVCVRRSAGRAGLDRQCTAETRIGSRGIARRMSHQCARLRAGAALASVVGGPRAGLCNCVGPAWWCSFRWLAVSGSPSRIALWRTNVVPAGTRQCIPTSGNRVRYRGAMIPAGKRIDGWQR
jgi:hypothetical protein